MTKHFEPIEGRQYDIIESVMSMDEVTALPEALQFKIRLCVEEIEENILSYSGSAWLNVESHIEGGVFSVTFKDCGTPFNPLEQSDPDVTLSLEQRKIGGLGIFLCKTMMDEVSYGFNDGCNELTMKLNIPA